MDEGAVVVVVVVVEHARHNSHDIIHSKTTLAAFSRFPLDATTRLARKRKRERKSGKKSSKKSSLFCGVSHSPKALSRLKKKRGINPTPSSSRRRRRARDRDPTKPTPFVRDDSFPFREFLEKANVSLFCRRRRRATFLSSSADVFFPLKGKKFPPRAHTTTTKEQRKRETSHEEKKTIKIVVSIVGNRRDAPSRDLP